MNVVHGTAVEQLVGARILVLNWRDVRHPLAGGAEQYIHQASRRWVAAGVPSPWLTARPSGQLARETIDGIRRARRRRSHPLSTRGPAPAAPPWRLRRDHRLPERHPVLRARLRASAMCRSSRWCTTFTRTSSPPASPRRRRGRPLPRGPASPARCTARGRSAAVSPSTRVELRRRLGFTGPIFVVPNGTIRPHAQRSARPGSHARRRHAARAAQAGRPPARRDRRCRAAGPRLRVESWATGRSSATAGPRRRPRPAADRDLARLPTRRTSATRSSTEPG